MIHKIEIFDAEIVALIEAKYGLQEYHWEFSQDKDNAFTKLVFWKDVGQNIPVQETKPTWFEDSLVFEDFDGSNSAKCQIAIKKHYNIPLLEAKNCFLDAVSKQGWKQMDNGSWKRDLTANETIVAQMFDGSNMVECVRKLREYYKCSLKDAKDRFDYDAAKLGWKQKKGYGDWVKEG